MSLYNIKRWDVVLDKNGITQVPLIYIEPDLAFLDAARINNMQLSCIFYNTQTPFFGSYDSAPIMGNISSSCDVPNCRPNFCTKTNDYVITLDSRWLGYPINNGVVQFFGMKND